MNKIPQSAMAALATMVAIETETNAPVDAPSTTAKQLYRATYDLVDRKNMVLVPEPKTKRARRRKQHKSK